jgi:hypothetical protein
MGCHLDSMTEFLGYLLENLNRFGCHFGPDTVSGKNRYPKIQCSSPFWDKKIRGAEAPLRARWATEGLFEVDMDEANEIAE